jgi:HAT1-interacting factor 1
MVDFVEMLPDSPDSATSAEIKANSVARLKDLTAQATLKYSVKDYNAAAELYSQATELQAEINGEMSPENADLLYAYGRCLYYVAVKNSDVLGSKVAGEKPQEGPKKSSKKKSKKEKLVEETEDPEKRLAEEVVTTIVEEKDGNVKSETEADNASKPYFQFTGDENWDTSDEGEDDAEEVGDGAEEPDQEDDFGDAYEVLDLARVLLLKTIEGCEDDSGKGKAKGESQEVRQSRERLADTHALQAEISLEAERFHTAVEDFRSALELKKALYPQESNLVAEAHYMLSLALEFASVTQQKNENGEVESGTEAVVDEAMREEAVQEMEAAIASCKMKIRQEEVNSQNGDQANGDAKDPKVTKKDIDEVRGLVKEMEQRVSTPTRFRAYV